MNVFASDFPLPIGAAQKPGTTAPGQLAAIDVSATSTTGEACFLHLSNILDQTGVVFLKLDEYL